MGKYSRCYAGTVKRCNTLTRYHHTTPSALNSRGLNSPGRVPQPWLVGARCVKAGPMGCDGADAASGVSYAGMAHGKSNVEKIGLQCQRWQRKERTLCVVGLRWPVPTSFIVALPLATSVDKLAPTPLVTARLHPPHRAWDRN